jgi:hypothetical protein
MTTRAEYAARAFRAHTAMERRFRRRDGAYRRPGWLGRIGVSDHLWPVARAFAATLDLAGVNAELVPRFDLEEAINRDLHGLERYWEPRGPYPAYASDVHRTPWGGDRYYDDNAWVGLALVQLERLRPRSAPGGRAAQLFAFADSGWSTDASLPHPGGTYWLEQGRGTGRRNHDRNTVSNAPNAELGMHLDELEGGALRRSSALRMCAWVQSALSSPDRLYFDKLRGDGTIDRALWSYNQGSMIGAAVLRYRAGAADLRQAAEAIARLALDHYAGRYFDQPAAFNAIFFRNLLLLHDVSGDTSLRELIRDTLSSYADEAWSRCRAGDLLPGPGGQFTLLEQSALVQVLALAAWDVGDYARLA